MHQNGDVLEKAHWGLYASGNIPANRQYNDDIQVWNLTEPITDFTDEPGSPYGSLPYVSITNRHIFDTLYPGVTATLQVDASDPGGGTIVRVELYDGVVKAGEDLDAPWSFEWKTKLGHSNLRVKATDSDKEFSYTNLKVNVTEKFCDIPVFGHPNNWEPLTPDWWEVQEEGDNKIYVLNNSGYLARAPPENEGHESEWWNYPYRLGEYSIIKDSVYIDFTLTARVKLPEEASDNDVYDIGFIFGYVDDLKYDMFHLFNNDYGSCYSNIIYGTRCDDWDTLGEDLLTDPAHRS
jgi:hypothetical protein